MAKKTEEKSKGVPLTDIYYYFSAKEQDRLDRGFLGYRSGQVLKLRERLLQLSPDEFNLAMQTMEKIVESGRRLDEKDGPQKSANKQKDAVKLFEQVPKAKVPGENKVAII